MQTCENENKNFKSHLKLQTYKFLLRANKNFIIYIYNVNQMENPQKTL